MAASSLYRRIQRIALIRRILFGVGVALMLIAPLIGILPGPGFIILFPIGLALALQNSFWAKRKFSRWMRHNPRPAKWVDRVLNRRRRPGRDRAASGEGEDARAAKAQDARAAKAQDARAAKAQDD